MKMLLRKRFCKFAAVALTAIISLLGNQAGTADDGYAQTGAEKPFYRIPGQNKTVRLIESAYPLPEVVESDAKSSGMADSDKLRGGASAKPDDPGRRTSDHRGNAFREALRDATIEDFDEDSTSGLDSDEQDEETQLFEYDKDRLPRVVDGRFVLPPLRASSVETENIGNGSIPESFRDLESDPSRLLPESGAQRQLDSKPWNWSVSHFAAANTFSFPRYFEDRQLERHGHERFPVLTPITSGLRFAATVPLLPYLTTLSPPCQCEYTLGYYRSGSCAPVLHQQPPLDKRALVVEAAAVGAAIAILP